MDKLEGLKFDERGLIPAIVQDVDTKEVLMLAYMKTVWKSAGKLLRKVLLKMP